VAHDVERLDLVSEEFEEMDAVLLAAEAAAGAAAGFRRRGETRPAQRCAQRAAALSRSCEGARTPALSLGGELATLSPREREVALLAVEGLSNGAIAEQLFVSVRTIESHLHHAFTKLGVTTREELAAVAGLSGEERGSRPTR
jgi:DNA-binding NarL/FixJ family response regulator